MCFACFIYRDLREMQDLALTGVRIWTEISSVIIAQALEQRGLDLGPGRLLGRITELLSQPSVLCRRESRKIMDVAWPVKLRSVVTCQGIIFSPRGPAQPTTKAAPREGHR